MACNNPETPADGATPAAAAPPTSPAPATAPASYPISDALITPCCNSSCRLPGCAATLNFCSDCYAERFRTHEIAHVNGGAHRPDLLVDQSVAALARSGDAGNVTPRYKSRTELDSENTLAPQSKTPVVAAIEDLRAKGFSAGQKIVVQASAYNPFDKHSGVRVPSPLSLSPLQQAETPPPEQKATNRCLACRKRLGLRGFRCRCGDLFCALHRYSDKHNCSFDYKAAGRLAIAKENPLVISSKIIKI